MKEEQLASPSARALIYSHSTSLLWYRHWITPGSSYVRRLDDYTFTGTGVNTGFHRECGVLLVLQLQGPFLLQCSEPAKTALTVWYFPDLEIRLKHLRGILVPSTKGRVQRWEEKSKQVQGWFKWRGTKLLVFWWKNPSETTRASQPAKLKSK